MTELRWVLLALGLVLILLLYLWNRGVPQQLLARFVRFRSEKATEQVRLEPDLTLDQAPDFPDELPSSRFEPPDDGTDNKPVSQAAESLPEKVVTLRFVPRGGDLPGDRVILALRAAGMRHGRFGIFHRHHDDLSDSALFSVANLTEPGSFDLSRISQTLIPGMSFFMVLPGPNDPIEAFEAMVETARELALELDGELRDERGSSWSIQRERYIREELIQYRHVLVRQSGER